MDYGAVPSRAGFLWADGIGQPMWLPYSRCRLRLADVEDRTVRVDAAYRRLHGVVRLVALRSRDSLEDARWGSGPVTTNGQHALAPVREGDLEDGGPVGPRAVIDVVVEGGRRALEVGEHPADESRDLVGAASPSGRRPGAASGRGAR